MRVIACQPANSCVMMHSVRAGRILDLPSEDTLSDGTAGVKTHLPTESSRSVTDRMGETDKREDT